MDTRGEFKLLSLLAEVNTGIAKAGQDFLAYQSEHGHLPGDGVHQLGVLLMKLGEQLLTAARDLEQQGPSRELG